MHAIKNEIERIIVLSADTDVFVVSKHYWEAFKSEGLLTTLDQDWCRKFNQIYSCTHISVKGWTRLILCHLLPLLHTTGCDYTSKVGTKLASLKVDLMKYFRDLHFGSSCPDFIASCEAYLVQLLKKKTTFTTMNQLRNYTYHHSRDVDVEQLPPTSHAIQLHMRRVIFQCIR